MSASARSLMILGLATCAAALVPFAWGLVAIGIGGVALAIALREGERGRALPLILALVALGATGGGILVSAA